MSHITNSNHIENDDYVNENDYIYENNNGNKKDENWIRTMMIF